MKIKEEKIIKDFKAVNFMRDVRDKISKDIIDMDYVQIKAYFDRKKIEFEKNKKHE